MNRFEHIKNKLLEDRILIGESLDPKYIYLHLINDYQLLYIYRELKWPYFILLNDISFDRANNTDFPKCELITEDDLSYFLIISTTGKILNTIPIEYNYINIHTLKFNKSK